MKRQPIETGSRALFMFAVIAAAFADAAELQVEVIAVGGQPVPGGGGTFSSFRAAQVNDSGQVAFQAHVLGAAWEFGLFRGDGGRITLIARDGQAAPEGSIRGIGLFPYHFHLNDSGQVSFYAQLTGISGANQPFGYLFSDGQALAQIARERQATAHGTLNSLSALSSLNNVGQATFFALGIGVFRWSGGALTPVALRGQSTPHGNLDFLYEGEDINDAGQVAFGVHDRGILRWDDGTLSPIALHGQAPPDGAGVFNFSIASGGGLFTPPARINNAGHVLFESHLAGTTDRYGIFLHDGQSLKQLLRAPEPIRSYLGTTGIYTAPLLNDAGQVAFLSDSSVFPVDDRLFFHDGHTLIEIARDGDPAPDGNGTFDRFGLAGLSDSGQLLFTAGFAGTVGGTTDRHGVFLADGGQLIQVVRDGQPFDLGGGDFRVIESVYSAHLNNHGQLALSLKFTDNTSGVFLISVVPEPSPLAAGLVGVSTWCGAGRRRRWQACPTASGRQAPRPTSSVRTAIYGALSRPAN